MRGLAEVVKLVDMPEGESGGMEETKRTGRRFTSCFRRDIVFARLSCLTLTGHHGFSFPANLGVLSPRGQGANFPQLRIQFVPFVLRHVSERPRVLGNQIQNIQRIR